MMLKAVVVHLSVGLVTALELELRFTSAGMAFLRWAQFDHRVMQAAIESFAGAAAGSWWCC
jgi:hypothetical protein